MSDLGALLRLIVIVDPDFIRGGTVEWVVNEALSGGARAIQLRSKSLSTRVLLETAERVAPLVRAAGGLLFVNDRIDVALHIGADGVHVGAEDLPLPAIRSKAPAGFLIGVSAHTPRRAGEAEDGGASYIGAGPVFQTTTKSIGRPALGPQRLAEIADAVSIPVVAIGGITPRNASRIRSTGAIGAAVIQSVTGSSDPRSAVEDLLAHLV